jgi:hypothetical protein
VALQQGLTAPRTLQAKLPQTQSMVQNLWKSKQAMAVLLLVLALTRYR